jgi:hypothetical protein
MVRAEVVHEYLHRRALGGEGLRPGVMGEPDPAERRLLALQLVTLDALVQALAPLVGVDAPARVVVHDPIAADRRLPEPPGRRVPPPDVREDLQRCADIIEGDVVGDPPLPFGLADGAREDGAQVRRVEAAQVLLLELGAPVVLAVGADVLGELGRKLGLREDVGLGGVEPLREGIATLGMIFSAPLSVV